MTGCLQMSGETAPWLICSSCSETATRSTWVSSQTLSLLRKPCVRPCPFSPLAIHAKPGSDPAEMFSKSLPLWAPHLWQPISMCPYRWTQQSWAPLLVALMPGGLEQGHLSYVCLKEWIHMVLGEQHGQILGGWGGPCIKRIQSFYWSRGSNRDGYRGSMCSPKFLLRSPFKVRGCKLRAMP